MATAEDTDMADASPTGNQVNVSDLVRTPYCDAFTFSKTERLALELYDQLQELELQSHLIKAQNEVDASETWDLSDDAVQEQLMVAQREAMEARAEYEIRNRSSLHVLVMDPILQAVHGSEKSDFTIERLSPLLAERDMLSMIHGSLAEQLASTMRALSTAEQQNTAAHEESRKLSHRLFSLAEDLQMESVEEIEDAQLRSRWDQAEKAVKESRRRKRILKGIISAMVVGSGINWAADESLQELVMDDEEDG